MKLSGLAYCNTKVDYQYLLFSNETDGFIVTKPLYWSEYDIAGFIGYLPTEESIYVVFKGSKSKLNFKLDMLDSLDPYHLWPDCNCRIHSGLQMAVEALKDDILTEVTRLM